MPLKIRTSSMLNILAVSGNQIVKFELSTILVFFVSLILFLYLDEANKKAISNAARVQKWTILPTDVSIPGGELGPTLKLKRFFFYEKYAAAIEQFYN